MNNLEQKRGRGGKVAARGLAALAVLAALLAPLGLNLVSAAQVAAKITASTGFMIENNTKLPNLPRPTPILWR